MSYPRDSAPAIASLFLGVLTLGSAGSASGAEFRAIPLTLNGASPFVDTSPRLNARGDVVAAVLDDLKNDHVSVRWSDRNASGVRIDATAGSRSFPRGIADDGTFVGWGTDLGYNDPTLGLGASARATFLVDPSGNTTLIPWTGGSSLQPLAINNRHVTVSALNGAVMVLSGSGIDRSLDFGTGFLANSINNHDTVVGFYSSGPLDQTALFTFDSDGIFTRYSSLGGRDVVRGSDINDLDVVSGWAEPAIAQNGTLEALLPSVAFTMANGEFTYLPSLFDQGDAAARALNDNGWVVGLSSPTEAWESTATLWRNGVPADLNTLVDGIPEGYTLAYATDVNNSGDIVVVAVGPTGRYIPILLTPIPEAECAAAAAVLLAGAALVRLPRRIQ